MATNVYGDGSNSTAGANTIRHHYDRAGIEAANRVNVYGQFADRKTMPKKMGKNFKISKFLHMYDRILNGNGSMGDGVNSAAKDFETAGFLTARSVDEVNTMLSNATLAEGAADVNKRSLQKVTFTTELARYGEMIDYTDEVDLFSEDNIQMRYREELGELANARMEDLIQIDMLGTGTVMYAGSAAAMVNIGDGVADDGSTDGAYTASYDLVRKAVKKLVQNRAKKNTMIVSGSNKIDTKTINKAFYAIIGADVKADLEVALDPVGDLAWIPVHKYAAAGKLAEGEVGAMHEARFIEAESAMTYAGQGADVAGTYAGNLQYTGTAGVDGKFDVFPILFPSQGAFATVGLKGEGKIKFHSKAPNQVELSNPYGTQGFFSYNFWYAGILLEEEKMLKVLVAATK